MHQDAIKGSADPLIPPHGSILVNLDITLAYYLLCEVLYCYSLSALEHSLGGSPPTAAWRVRRM
jgi:hypothetical protein